MCLFLCNCVGGAGGGGETNKCVSVCSSNLPHKYPQGPSDDVRHWLTCCGSPSVKGSLVATWNMISLPRKEVKTASLPVWPWQTSSPPLNLSKKSVGKISCNFTHCICHFLQPSNRNIIYPVKPCSWMVSPKMDRNSLNSSLSSLLPSMSSSVNWGREGVDMIRRHISVVCMKLQGAVK